MKSLLILWMLLFSLTNFAGAHNRGILGLVWDKEGEPIIGAMIEVYENDKNITGAFTDADGSYSVKIANPGMYNVKASFSGYQTVITRGVIVYPDKNTVLKLVLEIAEDTNRVPRIVMHKESLLDKYSVGCATSIDEQIEKMPKRTISPIAATTTCIGMYDNNGELSILGARTEGTVYYIDGITINVAKDTTIKKKRKIRLKKKH